MIIRRCSTLTILSKDGFPRYLKKKVTLLLNVSDISIRHLVSRIQVFLRFDKRCNLLCRAFILPDKV